MVSVERCEVMVSQQRPSFIPDTHGVCRWDTVCLARRAPSLGNTVGREAGSREGQLSHGAVARGHFHEDTDTQAPWAATRRLGSFPHWLLVGIASGESAMHHSIH